MPQRSSCTVIAAVDALGDTWSILVLRTLFYGVRRFNDIQHELGISRSVLAARLNRLVELGVVRVEHYQEAGERSRPQYRLTRKGVDLLPVIVGLKQWGDRYSGLDAIALVDGASGEPVGVALTTPSGHLVDPRDIIPGRPRPD